MPIVATNYGVPGGNLAEFSLGSWRAKFVTIALDNSYPTTGEILTAASLGWVSLICAIPVEGGFSNAAGTLSHTAIVKASANRKQLTFQAQETGAAVDGPHKEATSTADLSLYSGLFLVIGH